jgi:hypothetical protein
MLCATKEEISILPVIGESVLPLAADLLAADPAFLETRIPEKSQLAENSRQGFGSTNRASHPGQTAAKSTLALGVSCSLDRGRQWGQELNTIPTATSNATTRRR